MMDLYDGKQKRGRRDELAQAVSSHIEGTNPNRLLTLLGQSIKWQKHTGELATGKTGDANETYDIFKGLAKNTHGIIKDDEKF